MKIEVTKDVPLPDSGKYPFADLEVGDSFVVPIAESNRVRALATYYKRKNSGTDFRTKKLDSGKELRIWRVA